MEYLLIGILLAAGLFLLLMEIFIPSYGLLSVGALGFLTGGLVLAFQMNMIAGIVALVLVLILLPIEIALGVKFFPRTWIGRRIVMEARAKTERTERSSDEAIFDLEGREGTTLSACRPSGVAQIDGQRIDVVAEGMMIGANRPIKVVSVDGNRVVIREKES